VISLIHDESDDQKLPGRFIEMIDMAGRLLACQIHLKLFIAQTSQNRE